MQRVRNHISSLPEHRRELEGRTEPDDQPELDDAVLEQHLARVRPAASGAVQKGSKSWVQCSQGSHVNGTVRAGWIASLRPVIEHG